MDKPPLPLAETIKGLEATHRWLCEIADEQSQPDYIAEYEDRVTAVESALAHLRRQKEVCELFESMKDIPAKESR